MKVLILFTLMMFVVGYVLVANLHRAVHKSAAARRDSRNYARRTTDHITASKLPENVEQDDGEMDKPSAKMLPSNPRKYGSTGDSIRKVSLLGLRDNDVGLPVRGQKKVVGDSVDLPMRVQKKVAGDSVDLPMRVQKKVAGDSVAVPVQLHREEPGHNVALPIHLQKKGSGNYIDQSMRKQKKVAGDNVDQSKHSQKNIVEYSAFVPVRAQTDRPPYNVALRIQKQKNSSGGILDSSLRKLRNSPRYYAGQPPHKQMYVPRRGNIQQPVRDIIWKDSVEGKNDPLEEITLVNLPPRNVSRYDSSVQYLPPQERAADFNIQEWRRQNAIAVQNNAKNWKKRNARGVENGVKKWQGSNSSVGDVLGVKDFPQRNKHAVELIIEKWKNKNALAVANNAKNWKEKYAAQLNGNRDKDSREKQEPEVKDRVKDYAADTLGARTGGIGIRDTPRVTKSSDDARTEGSSINHKNVDFLYDLAFMPLYPITCEELFQHVTGLEKSGFFTLEFLVGLRALNAHLAGIVKRLRVTHVENHSGLYEKQQLATIRLVQMPFVRTICETGFNAGHSTLLYLMANKNAQVYSFDIGGHAYSKQMASYIENEYPGRLHVTWGNSMKTVPDFHGHFPRVTCDVISVDGGQTTEVAYWDFVNFRKMAACRHLILFHNYPDVQRKSSAIGRVWEGKKRSGELSEIFQCQYKTKVHGFSLGRYNGLEKCDQV